MKVNKQDKNKCGIYCIRNKITNHVYIGKSKNIYRRIIRHCYDLNIKNIEENRHLINAWHKYGRENFEYFVIEYLNIDEELVANRELYWMRAYNSLNSKYGYNLRSDSKSMMIVHQSTSLKISQRLKKEWAEGTRQTHSEKLANNWKNNETRKIKQAVLFSKTLTKYRYNLYTLNHVFIETCYYSRLLELQLKNVFSQFKRKNSNYVKCKQFYVEKIND